MSAKHGPIFVFLTVFTWAFFILTPNISEAFVPQVINYQGYLTDTGGNPVPDNTYTMTFSLYTTATDGTAEWSEVQSVVVINGIYNVSLGEVTSFPAALFVDPLYLGVGVSPDSEMQPRQMLTSSPFAMRAEVADTVVDGGIDTVHLMDNAVTEEKIADSSITGDKINDGTVTAADIQDGSGSGLDADRLDGFSSGDFVQNTQDYGRSGIAPNLYEGTSTLASKYVNESGDTMIGSLDVSSFTLGSGFVEAIRGTLTTPTNGAGVYGTSNGTNSQGVHGSATGIDGVGVFGEVNGARAYGVQGIAAGEIGRGVYGVATNTSGFPNIGGWFEAAGGTARGVYGHASNSGNWTNFGGWFEADGSVGIGVKGVGSYAGGEFTSHGSNGQGVRASATGVDAYGLLASSQNGDGIYAVSRDEVGRGVYGEATNDGNYENYGGYFLARGYDGYGVYGEARGDSGEGVRGVTSGNYGYAVVGEATYTGGTTVVGGHFTAHSRNGRGVYGESKGITGRGVFGWATNTGADTNYGGYFRADGENGVGIYAIGGPSGYAGDFGGTVKVEVLEITGADLSEQYTVRDKHSNLLPTPGKVVSIDPENPGDLVVSRTAYDRKVAGIISGAGDISIGMLMGKEGKEPDGKSPVALSGRVYCLADASGGAIEPGNLLTTSHTPGHAMKVTDYGNAQGAILGKAMTSLYNGKGLVLVLVTLQ